MSNVRFSPLGGVIGLVVAHRPLLISTASAPLNVYRPWLPLIDRLFPRWLLRAVANVLPWPALHRVLHIADVMHTTSVDVYNQKKKALAAGDEAVVEQLGAGKDIMSVLSECSRLTKKV